MCPYMQPYTSTKITNSDKNRNCNHNRLNIYSLFFYKEPWTSKREKKGFFAEPMANIVNMGTGLRQKPAGPDGKNLVLGVWGL